MTKDNTKSWTFTFQFDYSSFAGIWQWRPASAISAIETSLKDNHLTKLPTYTHSLKKLTLFGYLWLKISGQTFCPVIEQWRCRRFRRRRNMNFVYWRLFSSAFAQIFLHFFFLQYLSKYIQLSLEPAIFDILIKIINIISNPTNISLSKLTLSPNVSQKFHHTPTVMHYCTKWYNIWDARQDDEKQGGNPKWVRFSWSANQATFLTGGENSVPEICVPELAIVLIIRVP